MKTVHRAHFYTVRIFTFNTCFSYDKSHLFLQIFNKNVKLASFKSAISTVKSIQRSIIALY